LPDRRRGRAHRPAAREALETDLVKLEVVADERTLLPDPIELLDPAEQLIPRRFIVLPYTNDDPVLARKLGAGRLRGGHATGLAMVGWHRKPAQHRDDRRGGRWPVVLDAGIGTASEAAQAMELGCDAVLLATAVTRAGDPERIGARNRLAVEARRAAEGAGGASPPLRAQPPSPAID